MTLHIIHMYTQGNVLYACVFMQFACCVFIYAYIHIYVYIN